MDNSLSCPADAAIVERDLHKWDYRHQIIGVARLTPTQPFVGVKLVEVLYHLHPRRVARILTASDPALRRQLRFSFWHTTGVFWYEVYEHLARRWHGGRRAGRKREPAQVIDRIGAARRRSARAV